MLRLVLLLFYLFAVSSISQQKQGGGIDPLGFTTPPPQGTTAEPTGPAHDTDQGGGIDPLG